MDDDEAREARTLRDRLDEMSRALARRPSDATPSSPVLVGQVFDDGDMPEDVPGFFAVRPVIVGGEEAEGATGSFGMMSGAKSVFLVLGSVVPESGDHLVARLIDGRWVARKDGGAGEPGVRPMRGILFHLFNHFDWDTGTAPISAELYRAAVRGPVSEVQRLKFKGAITGGTFTLAHGGYTTAPIAWSADNATLLDHIDAALIALPIFGPDDRRHRRR
jgi:hypothetical protein